MDFLAISGCDTNLYHSQKGATVLSLRAHVNERILMPKFLQFQSYDLMALYKSVISIS